MLSALSAQGKPKRLSPFEHPCVPLDSFNSLEVHQNFLFLICPGDLPELPFQDLHKDHSREPQTGAAKGRRGQNLARRPPMEKQFLAPSPRCVHPPRRPFLLAIPLEIPRQSLKWPLRKNLRRASKIISKGPSLRGFLLLGIFFAPGSAPAIRVSPQVAMYACIFLPSAFCNCFAFLEFGLKRPRKRLSG